MSQESMSPGVTDDDKLWAMLSYLFSPLVPVIVLLMEDKKNRPYIKFNAIQSLALWAVALVLSPICGVGLFVLLYMLYLAYLAYQGQGVQVPMITDFIKNQGWA
jgi:uncharacterized membrane protein